LYTSARFSGFAEIYSEGKAMIPHHLTEEQQQQAKLLEAKIRLAVEQEISALARLLVSKSDDELFGQTEFQVRELVLRMGAKAFQEYLSEKKTATTALR
jgi:outer membrane PBP1 activator LpoA protein